MYIPEKRKNRQITLFDFNQSCGMEQNGSKICGNVPFQDRSSGDSV